ncbi:MAG: DMT family transporter [Gammaproteobacteria bacterium]
MTRVHAHLNITAMALLVVLCLSWGLQQVAIKVAIPAVSPVAQAAIRSVGAAILIWLWMVVRGVPLRERDGTLWWGIAAGLLFAAEFVLIYWGLEFTNASRAVIFLYLSPFVVALGAQWFIPGEHLTRLQVVGLVSAFAGIVVAFGESLAIPDPRVLVGDAMLVGAAVLWGATTVLIKASALATAAPSKTLLYQLGVSALVLPPAALLLGEGGIRQVTPLMVGSLLYQAVWVAFITYLVWFWLVRHYPAARLASFTFLTPLFGVMAGGWLLAEPVTPWLILALLLVGAGIYLVNRPARGR